MLLIVVLCLLNFIELRIFCCLFIYQHIHVHVAYAGADNHLIADTKYQLRLKYVDASL